MTTRREAIAAPASALEGWVRSAQTQSPRRIPRIGIPQSLLLRADEVIQ